LSLPLSKSRRPLLYKLFAESWLILTILNLTILETCRTCLPHIRVGSMISLF
jgi:hypothetical protein